MKRAALVALCCASVACDATIGPEDGPARIRFVNAVPDALSALQFSLSAGPAASLEQGASSAYVELTADVHTLLVRDESNAWTVSGDIEVVGGLYQSVIAFGNTGEEGAILVSDEPGRPRSGGANVRLLHLAPLAGTLDVHVLADGQPIEPDRPLIGTLAYPSNPGHIRVTAGTARVIITASGTDDVLFRSEPLQLAAGDNYTIVLTNTPEGALQIIQLRDGA